MLGGHEQPTALWTGKLNYQINGDVGSMIARSPNIRQVELAFMS
jgi:hypothetical protein